MSWFKNTTDKTRTLRPWEGVGLPRAKYEFPPGVPVQVQTAHLNAVKSLPKGVLVECEPPKATSQRNKG